MTSIENYQILSLYPENTISPNEITEYDFKFGSLAGSVGNKIDVEKKPGINEDGAMVVFTESKIVSLLIDGHYSRDTTELLLDMFKKNIEVNSHQLEMDIEDYNFLKTCNLYTKQVVERLQALNAKGEASFVISLIDLKQEQLFLYSVGDVMLFIADPLRNWAPFYQLGQRHYYEWINIKGVNGYHFHSTNYNKRMSIIITTDGLIDDPVININDIEKLFTKLLKKPSGITKAGYLVKYALNELEFDDNITCIFINNQE